MYKFIFGTLALLFIAIIASLSYFDVFRTISISEKEVGPYKIVYEEHKGAYNGIKDVQDKIYSSLLKDKIETTKGFGIYYDNPSEVPTEELRSIGGCIVEIKDYDSLKSLQNKYKIKEYYSPKASLLNFHSKILYQY